MDTLELIREIKEILPRPPYTCQELIQEIRRFIGTQPDASEIPEIPPDSRQEDLEMERKREEDFGSCDPETAMFYIARQKNGGVRIRSEDDFRDYIRKIQDMRGIDRFLESHSQWKNVGTYRKLFEKAKQYLSKGQSYLDPSEDFDEQIARILNEVFKKCLEQVIRGLGRAIPSLKDKKERQIQLELLGAVNDYLESLGIYSRIARIGRPVDDELYSYYEPLPHEEAEHPQVRSIIVPAYALFLQGIDGEWKQRVFDGKIEVGG